MSYFEPGAFAADMRASGYATAQSLGSDELNRRYFSGRSDGFRLYGSGQMMAAQV